MATVVTTGGTARVQTDDPAVLSYLGGLPSASEAETTWHDWAELRGEREGLCFYDCSEAAAREAHRLSTGG